MSDNKEIEKFGDRPCPVCGTPIFADDVPYSTYEICDVCGWMDDRQQEDDADLDHCANIMSLNQARKAWKEGKEVY